MTVIEGGENGVGARSGELDVLFEVLSRIQPFVLFGGVGGVGARDIVGLLRWCYWWDEDGGTVDRGIGGIGGVG